MRDSLYVSRYNDKFGVYPTGFSICAYDSLLARKKAVQTAKSVKPRDTARTLKGLKFNGLRGESAIRKIDGQLNGSTYFGRLVHIPNTSSQALEAVIEIPATQTWLKEVEVINNRKKNQAPK